MPTTTMIDAGSIDAALAAACARGDVAGVVAMAGDAEATLYRAVFGRRDITQPEKLAEDAIFRLASMTKALTSVAAMQLVEQGRLVLDAPIARVLPHLAAPMVLDGFLANGMARLRPAAGPITLRHLLTHTAGYGYDVWNADLMRAHAALGLPGRPTNTDELARCPLLFDPGTRWNYSIATDIVGHAIEAVSGQRIDAYLADHVTGPLGMVDTTFSLSPTQLGRLVAMHQRQADGSLTAGQRAAGSGPGFLAGGGGMCGTAADYLRLLRMQLGGGTLDGVRLLHAATVTEMGRNQIGTVRVQTLRTTMADMSYDANFFPGMEQTWRLGFLINTEAGPNGRAAGSLAWGGLVNTYFWLDPASGVAGVLLTQSLPFADPAALALLGALERGVYGVG